MRRRILSCLFSMMIFLSSVLFGSCAIAKHPLEDIYADYSKETANPIIIIPGIKGSELKNYKNDRNVWGGWFQLIPSDFDDLKLDAIADEKFEKDFEVFNQKSDVKASAVFRRWRLLSILGQSTDIDIYEDLYTTLEKVGHYVDVDNQIQYDSEGYLTGVDQGSVKINKNDRAIFSFYYDWRRDNILNAVNLGKFIEAVKKTYYPGQDKIRFDIVAHSMGGLIARFYVGYHCFCDRAANDHSLVYRSVRNEEPEQEIPKSINKVILLGTPSGGSMEILRAFYDGSNVETLFKKRAWKIIPTMPSAYQLLPQRCFGDCFLAFRKDTATQSLLEQINGKAECNPQNGKFSIFNDVIWKAMNWSAFSNEWDQDDFLGKKQRLISKGLARAEEFTYRLKKADDKMQNFFILLGGDCASTLYKGLVYEKKEESNSTKQNRRILTVLERKKLEEIHDLKGETFDPKTYFKPGDGMVLREESMLRLAAAKASFVCKSHGSLFKDDTLKDSLLYELLIKDYKETPY